MSPLWNLEKGEGSPGQHPTWRKSRRNRDESCEQVCNSLEQLARVAKDDDCYIGGAKYAQLVRLLEETILALEKGDGAVTVVGDGCD